MNISVDTITLVIFLAVWSIWLVWELLLLKWRADKKYVKTISMVAKDRGYHISSIVYTWAGSATHWWWTASEYATVAGTIAFWAITAALLVQDVILWRSDRTAWPTWLRIQRSPLLLLIIGALAGRFLFPQAG